MYINRKTKKLSTLSPNVVMNEEITDANMHHRLHKQIEIVSYPTLEYLCGAALIGFSIYLIYSVSGGKNGIQGFNNRLWWQFIVAIFPMVLGVCFIVTCQIESIMISRKENWIISTKTRFFCFITENIKKQFSDLIGLSVTKNGAETVNIGMVNYHIVLSFKTYDEMIVLRCLTEAKILEYFEDMRRIFDNEEISQKKVLIQNLVK